MSDEIPKKEKVAAVSLDIDGMLFRTSDGMGLFMPGEFHDGVKVAGQALRAVKENPNHTDQELEQAQETFKTEIAIVRELIQTANDARIKKETKEAHEKIKNELSSGRIKKIKTTTKKRLTSKKNTSPKINPRRALQNISEKIDQVKQEVTLKQIKNPFLGYDKKSFGLMLSALDEDRIYEGKTDQEIETAIKQETLQKNDVYLQTLFAQLTMGSSAKKIYLYCGSSRRSPSDHYSNLVKKIGDGRRCLFSGSMPTILEAVQERLQELGNKQDIEVELVKTLAADYAKDEPDPGETWQKMKEEGNRQPNSPPKDDTSGSDHEKISFIYEQTHELASKRPEGMDKTTPYIFADDRIEYLTFIKEFYEKHPDMLPAGVEVHIHHREKNPDGGEPIWERFSTITGTGDIDPKPYETAAIYCLGLTLDQGGTITSRYGTGELTTEIAEKGLFSARLKSFVAEKHKKRLESERDAFGPAIIKNPDRKNHKILFFEGIIANMKEKHHDLTKTNGCIELLLNAKIAANHSGARLKKIIQGTISHRTKDLILKIGGKEGLKVLKNHESLLILKEKYSALAAQSPDSSKETKATAFLQKALEKFEANPPRKPEDYKELFKAVKQETDCDLAQHSRLCRQIEKMVGKSGLKEIANGSPAKETPAAEEGAEAKSGASTPRAGGG